MQGIVVQADDFGTRKKVTIVKLSVNRHGEARVLAKLEKSGEKNLEIRFSPDKKELLLIIPTQVMDMPDTIGRGDRRERN